MAVERADTLVVGGGPAGCSAAIALRQRAIERVVIVDDGDPSALRLGESIPPDTRVLFEALGAWPGFEAQGHAPCLGSRSSWGADELGYNDFLFNIHGPGWHLDRLRFDALLRAEARRAGAELRGATRVSRLSRGPSGELLAHTSGERAGVIEARFVIDATGAGSRIARALGARQRIHDRLLCLAAFVDCAAALGHLTLLEAVDYGWWYAAALPGDRGVVMLATDPAIARQERLVDPHRWRACLGRTRHIGPALDELPQEPHLIARVAPSFLLDRVAGPGWLAVGDAASAYDPLSAQGLYKALLTGLHGGSAAASWLAGNVGALAHYEHLVTAGFVDFLRNISRFYGDEGRWPDAPFWKPRRVPIPSRPRRPGTLNPSRSEARLP